MQFFVEENSFLSKATDPDALLARDPLGMRDALDAVKDLRAQNRQHGNEGWSFDRGWKHVASIYAPIMEVAEVLDPEWLNGNRKRNFYSWLDQEKNRRWLTYDRRRIPAKRSDLVTFVNGKEV